MKSFVFVCLAAFSVPLMSSATEVSVFEVKSRSEEVSVAAVHDRVNTDREATALYMYAPGKKLKSFEIGEQTLSAIFEQAKNDTEEHAFFGKCNSFLLRDDKTHVFYIVHFEDDPRSPYVEGRFRMAPMHVLAGEWLVPTGYLHASQKAVITEHLKAP